MFFVKNLILRLDFPTGDMKQGKVQHHQTKKLGECKDFLYFCRNNTF